jgi:sulfonate transport system permease protein
MTQHVLHRRRALRGFVIPAGLLVAWQLLSHTGAIDARFLPPLEDVIARFATELRTGELLRNLVASLTRDLVGFVIGSALGIAFGAVLGLSRLADHLFRPSFDALKQIALLAWIPLISIWFGFGETSKVVFITLAAFIPVALNTYEGVRGASTKLVEVGAALTFSRRQLFTRIFLPSAVPSILTGVHLALIYSWLATVAAEYFMSVGPGIGGLVVAGRERFEMDLVMLGVVILGAVGFALSRTALVVEHHLMRWRSA